MIIINPINNKRFLVNSKEGINLLKKYIRNFKGGMMSWLKSLFRRQPSDDSQEEELDNEERSVSKWLKENKKTRPSGDYWDWEKRTVRQN